jgi:hypothetical protein
VIAMMQQSEFPTQRQEPETTMTDMDGAGHQNRSCQVAVPDEEGMDRLGWRGAGDCPRLIG